ncbi:hypothetical protein ACWZEH_02255 [Streptomyces sp. QTS137]
MVGPGNATAPRAGHTLYAGQAADFPVPAFVPECFAVVHPADLSRFEQFRRGIAQLNEEGVVQVLASGPYGAKRRCSRPRGRCRSGASARRCPRPPRQATRPSRRRPRIGLPTALPTVAETF